MEGHSSFLVTIPDLAFGCLRRSTERQRLSRRAMVSDLGGCLCGLILVNLMYIWRLEIDIQYVCGSEATAVYCEISLLFG